MIGRVMSESVSQAQISLSIDIPSKKAPFRPAQWDEFVNELDKFVNSFLDEDEYTLEITQEGI